MDPHSSKIKQIDARKLSPKAQGALRFRDVHAVLEQGKTQEEVAQMLGVARTTVSYWLKLYRKRGEAALKRSKSGGEEPEENFLVGKQPLFATLFEIVVPTR